MSTARRAISPTERLARQLGLQSPLMLWLGFLASTALHGSIIALAVFLWMPPETSAEKEKEKVDFHAVALVVKEPPSPDQESRNNPDGQESNADKRPDARFASNNATTSKPQEVPDKPPVQIDLPKGGVPTIGPGAAKSNFLPGSGSDLVLPNGITSAATSAAKSLGNGDATFFTIQEKGKRLVFVIDRSGSMIHDRAMAFAKQQLVRSLNGLSNNHQLQVIFYNEHPMVLTIDNASPQQFIRATPRNIEKVIQRISVIKPDGGTKHITALRAALKLQPDAIYFLTDAGSELDAGEINEVRRLNRGKSRIHCIKFGKGADLERDNSFLKQIAAMTGGTYFYHDVQRQRR